MMKNKCISLTLFLFCFFFIQDIKSQLSEDAYIALITCRPGDEIFNSWGHTGIRVYDKANNIDHVYNYGMFSFSEPNFMGKFLKGKLLYWVDIEPYANFIYKYHQEKRSVLEDKLDLSQDEKVRIFDALNENLKAENRKYLYDFFFDNCSTRPRDIVLNELTVDQDLNKKGRTSFRHLLDPYILHQSWIDFGIDLIIGSIADKQATLSEQMFLPEKMQEQFKNTHTKGNSIISESNLLADYEYKIKERKQSSFFKPDLIALILLILEFILFIKYRKEKRPRILKYYNNLWFFLLGVSGLLIAFMWFGTDHDATKNNLNLLWMNPLFFLMLLPKKKIIALILIICLALTFISSFFIQEIHSASKILIVITTLKLWPYITNKPSRHKTV